MATNPTSLNTEPITGNGGKRPAKTAAKKKGISKAIRGGAGAGKTFAEGDQVLFHVKHLHGLHGTVAMKTGAGQYVVRGGEGSIEGQLFQFSADELESAAGVDLTDTHHTDRVKWDYPED